MSLGKETIAVHACDQLLSAHILNHNGRFLLEHVIPSRLIVSILGSIIPGWTALSVQVFNIVRLLQELRDHVNLIVGKIFIRLLAH